MFNFIKLFYLLLYMKMSLKKQKNDWICNECNELNYSYRTKCRKCNQNNYYTDFIAISKPGDWHCKCGYHNYRGNNECRKCGNKTNS